MLEKDVERVLYLHQFPAVLHWLVSLHPRLCMLSEIS